LLFGSGQDSHLWVWKISPQNPNFFTLVSKNWNNHHVRWLFYWKTGISPDQGLNLSLPVLSRLPWRLVKGSDQNFDPGQVRSATLGFRKFPLKIPIFSLNSKKISSGHVKKKPGWSRVGSLFTAGQKYAQVGSGPIWKDLSIVLRGCCGWEVQGNWLREQRSKIVDSIPARASYFSTLIAKKINKAPSVRERVICVDHRFPWRDFYKGLDRALASAQDYPWASTQQEASEFRNMTKGWENYHSTLSYIFKSCHNFVVREKFIK